MDAQVSWKIQKSSRAPEVKRRSKRISDGSKYKIVMHEGNGGI